MGDWKPFLFGGASSIIAEFATFPIDTTKIRLQIQGEVSSVKPGPTNSSQYRGMLHAMYQISRQEGPVSLYRGIQAAILRQAIYGTIKIGIYQRLKKKFVVASGEETLRVNVICGVTAGVSSSVCANPTDLLKIRMQARNVNFQDLSLMQAFTKIAKKEGVRGLWRGVIPTEVRAAVVCGVELPVYDITKKHILKRGLLPDDMLCHFTSSFIAGLAGALASNPIDVVRTRLMNQQKIRQIAAGEMSPVIYANAFDCFRQTLRNEGILALWKGFIPNWFRLGPWNIIFFMSYEQIVRLDKSLVSQT